MKSGAYRSEITRFIDDLREKNPQIVEQQKKNRATWWDHPQDLQASREKSAASVPAPSYVYFPLPKRVEDKPDESGNKLSNPSRPA
jgi:hypothetical protein